RTVVSRIDIQHAREILFLRLSTEIEIAKVLVQIIDDGGIARLMAWIDRLETELWAGDQNSFRSADNRFHEEMYALAAVPGLIQVLRARRSHHDRIRGLFLRQADRRPGVIDEHRAIVDALKNRDAAAAEQATRLHLGKSLAIIDEIREQYPDYFF
ncbi:MAG: GntR family transcriptional regulator, partial [Rhodospirillaceae bacterium]